MKTPGLTKNYTSDAAIPARRIVKYGSADGHVNLAAVSTDYLMGVSDLGCTAAGDRVDIILGGIAYVEYGGTVTRGQPLTSDLSGKAIEALSLIGGGGAPYVYFIGFAEVSGVSGDIGAVRICPFVTPG
jgi:hypothetical protein